MPFVRIVPSLKKKKNAEKPIGKTVPLKKKKKIYQWKVFVNQISELD